MKPQSLYSPNMVLCDFFLFPKLKTTMKGQHFATIDEIKTESLTELKAIPKSEFQKCLKDWRKCWYKCIISGGRGYYEADNTDDDDEEIIF